MKKLTNKKQQGVISVEVAIVFVILMLVLGSALAQVPDIMYSWRLENLQGEVSDVSTAAWKAKKKRNNYKKVTMQKLCDDHYLSDTYCDGTPGQAANSFGGDVIYSANTTNPGLRDIKVTIPNDPDRINDIADTLASQSRDRCVEAAGCATLKVAGSTITVTM